ncbi:Golgi-specific brefeldin A-resistance guanine nucleotide exchange factor 1 [Geodia barretti]|uniref:Golgi-specific brefeldin A-resistance guanine nucleotide exchange factor 1 n=1 Tax=Geodia barretti TaxID=519541 RepID=A0AA35TFA1_GEOBA|nr:Golgi-specific brefeldin A-resistance guanine nucleotide exchange factor 1 [Geodia barretti]
MRGEVSVVQGEVSQLLSAMRKTGRWSGHARTEGEQDPLVRGLHKLQTVLNGTPDLRTLDVMVFLHPFCEIIQSDDTTGPVTGMAISSLDRFLAYGLISPGHPSAAGGVAALSESVTHARFVGTNPASDEVVLMKILQVLHTLMLTPVGRLLSNESVCEIMQSCFRICFETRLSELLRNYAESTLVDMVQLLFIQLPSFNEDEYTVDDTASIIDQTITAGGEEERGSVEPCVEDDVEEEGGEGEEEGGGRETTDSNGGDEHDELKQQEEGLEEGEAGLKRTAHEAEFVSSDVITATSRHRQGTLAPYGLPCVRELLRFLVSIINVKERNNSESLLHIGLNLVTVVLESGREDLCRFPSLAQLVQDNLSRSLFTLLRHSNFSVFSATLRAVCLLLQHCRVHLRFQVEWGLATLMELFTAENTARLSHEKKDAVLETILRLCHYPYLMAELYVNYDCSLYCSNVFENLTKLLSKSSLPTQGLSSNHLLSLDALLAIIKSFQSCQQQALPDNALAVNSQLSETEGENAPSGALATSQEGSTQINSAGIIFSSRPERETVLVEEMSITSVRSDSALADHVTETAVEIAGQSCPASGMDTVKAASGYMMAIRGTREGDFPPETTVVELATPKELIEIRQRKKVILAATEQFNLKPKQGITFLQERRVISASDSPQYPAEVASFLVDNPWLDKAKIGEYIGDRKNPPILDAFVKHFSLHGTHLVDALRHFLESFRLPGESPVIARILETFSEHWLSCNKEELGKVFANRDAVYVLCYAILMLNTDQYSTQVKKRMSLEEFIHNQRKINNGEDFPRQFLTDIFNRIREDEIIMPDEHKGQVKENYQWKVLLHRSNGPEATYLPVNVTSYNQDLYLLCWSQSVAALSYVFENAEERPLY